MATGTQDGLPGVEPAKTEPQIKGEELAAAEDTLEAARSRMKSREDALRASLKTAGLPDIKAKDSMGLPRRYILDTQERLKRSKN